MPFDVVALAEHLTASPWFYVVLFAAVAVDAIVPVFPGEVLLTIGGSFIAADSWVGFMAVAATGAAGAVAGDLMSYRVGRSGQPLARHLRPDGRASSVVTAVTGAVHRHGTAVLLGARFIPGGRTAATLAAGYAHFPIARFVVLGLVSAIGWSTYTVALGYAGDATLGSDPLVGAAIGCTAAITISVALDLTTTAFRHRRPA